MNISLIIMAAGMGSRYGGLKQIDPLGPNGEILMEYAVFDAIRAGFTKVIFVIRKDFEKSFKQQIGNKFSKYINVVYAFQELNDLPEGYSLPQNRVKPWGTGHAILACKNFISEPFVVQNADDFYGYDAYLRIFKAFKESSNDDCFLVGYSICNTLSPHGSVTRGICNVNEGQLVQINERKNIHRTSNNTIEYYDDDNSVILNEDSICSMNFWGFSSSYIDKLEIRFKDFLDTYELDLTSEWLIPEIVDQTIRNKESTFRVLSSDSNWFGVTYPEDKSHVMKLLSELHENNEYPKKLWK